MKPIPAGAIELPNDKYRFRISELEEEIASLAEKNATLLKERTIQSNEISRLHARIAELEKAMAK